MDKSENPIQPLNTERERENEENLTLSPLLSLQRIVPSDLNQMSISLDDPTPLSLPVPVPLAPSNDSNQINQTSENKSSNNSNGLEQDNNDHSTSELVVEELNDISASLDLDFDSYNRHGRSRSISNKQNNFDAAPIERVGVISKISSEAVGNLENFKKNGHDYREMRKARLKWRPAVSTFVVEEKPVPPKQNNNNHISNNNNSQLDKGTTSNSLPSAVILPLSSQWSYSSTLPPPSSSCSLLKFSCDEEDRTWQSLRSSMQLNIFRTSSRTGSSVVLESPLIDSLTNSLGPWDTNNLREFARMATDGTRCIKHSRYGFPKTKIVRVNLSTGLIDWGSNFMSLKDTYKVKSDKTRLTFFSVHSRERVLQLETASQDVRDIWVEGLKTLYTRLINVDNPNPNNSIQDNVSDQDNKDVNSSGDESNSQIINSNGTGNNTPNASNNATSSGNNSSSIAGTSGIPNSNPNANGTTGGPGSSVNSWSEDRVKLMVESGAMLIKHGRHGKPHDKLVRVDSKGANLIWGSSSIPLSDVHSVIEGKNTKVFEKVHFKVAHPQLCFSIVMSGSEYTLNFQAKTVSQRDAWVAGLRACIRDAKSRSSNKQKSTPSTTSTKSLNSANNSASTSNNNSTNSTNSVISTSGSNPSSISNTVNHSLKMSSPSSSIISPLSSVFSPDSPSDSDSDDDDDEAAPRTNAYNTPSIPSFSPETSISAPPTKIKSNHIDDNNENHDHPKYSSNISNNSNNASLTNNSSSSNNNSVAPVSRSNSVDTGKDSLSSSAVNSPSRNPSQLRELAANRHRVIVNSLQASVATGLGVLPPSSHNNTLNPSEMNASGLPSTTNSTVSNSATYPGASAIPAIPIVAVPSSVSPNSVSSPQTALKSIPSLPAPRHPEEGHVSDLNISSNSSSARSSLINHSSNINIKQNTETLIDSSDDELNGEALSSILRLDSPTSPKLSSNSHLSPTHQYSHSYSGSGNFSNWSQTAFETIAANGVEFIKHGRFGKPHSKIVTVRDGLIQWGTGSIPLHAVDQVRKGKNTKVFEKVSFKLAHPSVCFSICLPKDKKTLDLQAADEAQRDQWVTGLSTLVLKIKAANGSNTANPALNQITANLYANSLPTQPTHSYSHSYPNNVHNNALHDLASSDEEGFSNTTTNNSSNSSNNSSNWNEDGSPIVVSGPVEVVDGGRQLRPKKSSSINIQRNSKSKTHDFINNNNQPSGVPPKHPQIDKMYNNNNNNTNQSTNRVNESLTKKGLTESAVNDEANHKDNHDDHGQEDSNESLSVNTASAPASGVSLKPENLAEITRLLIIDNENALNQPEIINNPALTALLKSNCLALKKLSQFISDKSN